MTEWIRPGPNSIDPDAKPDGVIVHVYSVPDGELLKVSAIDLRNVDDVAGNDGLEFAERAVCLVAYDGDTGERLPWPWSTIEEATMP